jgi:hypothetical protein
MNQGQRRDLLMKKTCGRKSRDTVPLISAEKPLSKTTFRFAFHYKLNTVTFVFSWKITIQVLHLVLAVQLLTLYFTRGRQYRRYFSFTENIIKQYLLLYLFSKGRLTGVEVPEPELQGAASISWL